MPWMWWFSVAIAASPGPEALAAWSKRTGVALPAPDALRAEGDGLVLLAPGESLLLAPADGPPTDARLDAALAAQAAPFEEAGLAMGPALSAACSVAGQPARCRQAVLEVAPGATLSLLAAQAPGADWHLVCLDRRPAEAGPCAALLGPSEPD